MDEGNGSKRKLFGRNKLEVLKRRNAMTALEAMFKKLEDVFSKVDPIPEVLILFGATTISPKEAYRLRFPTKCYEGKVLNWSTCRMALFQKLVSTDVFGTAKLLKPGTKITVLLKASRDSAATTLGLITKPTYKISHRGNHFIFNFVCKGHEINPEISHLDMSLNISGIEPFDHESPVAVKRRSTSSPPFQNATPISSSKRRISGQTFPGLQRKLSKLDIVEESPDKKAMDVISSCTENGDQEQFGLSSDTDSHLEDIIYRSSTLTLTEANEPELIWFQIPESMTGFRDKTSKAA